MSWARHGHYVGFTAALLLGAGCSPTPSLTVSNQSTVTISNILISGAGFTNRIGNLPAGSEFQIALRPASDSGIRLTFDAGTRHIDSGDQGYIQPRGRDRLQAVIDADLKVSVSDNLNR